MRKPLIALVALLLAAPAAAQQHTGHAGHGAHQAQAGKLPAGWQARVDRDQPLEGITFMAMGDGYHATTGPAAVLYNPQWAKRGDYEVAARFTQTKAPRHPEAYGIVLGGSELAAPEQSYTYFLVRGTGEYFLATRKGTERVKLVDWTPHAAIRKQDAAGKQVNVLGAEVRGAEVVFTVNGTEVARRPRSEVATDGIHGYRINHNLDVMIEPVTR